MIPDYFKYFFIIHFVKIFFTLSYDIKINLNREFDDKTTQFYNNIIDCNLKKTVDKEWVLYNNSLSNEDPYTSENINKFINFCYKNKNESINREISFYENTEVKKIKNSPLVTLCFIFMLLFDLFFLIIILVI